MRKASPRCRRVTRQQILTALNRLDGKVANAVIVVLEHVVATPGSGTRLLDAVGVLVTSARNQAAAA